VQTVGAGQCRRLVKHDMLSHKTDERTIMNCQSKSISRFNISVEKQINSTKLNEVNNCFLFGETEMLKNYAQKLGFVFFIQVSQHKSF
jgi:hypothetical protein